MKFDKNGFMEFIESNFSYDGSTKRIINNSIEWAVENLAEREITNYIFYILDEPFLALEEIERFNKIKN